MKRVIFLGGLALGVAVLHQSGVLSSGGSGIGGRVEDVVDVRANDAAVIAAREAALAHLPRFLETARNRPADWENVSLKVAMRGGTRVENVWVAAFIERAPKQYEAVLANEPVDLPGLEAGDVVAFSEDQINDWAFVSGGKGYGFFSVRALIDRVPEEEAAAMRAFLADDPVPSGW